MTYKQETQYAQLRAYGPAHWASLDPEAAMAALGSRRVGLNMIEVAERLARYGQNTLSRLKPMTSSRSQVSHRETASWPLKLGPWLIGALILSGLFNFLQG